MFIDARRLHERDALTADLCVVGSGAAGISIALELLDSPLRVLLLERGGVSGGNGDDDIYRVVDGMPPRLVPDPGRPWYFGGGTNHWEGNCRPLDAVDFERREWIPASGWPIRRDELLPFYERAQELCGLGDFHLYDVGRCRPHLAHHPLDLTSGVLASRVVHTCPVLSFADLHGRRLRESDNVHVLANARVTRLETDARGGTVRAAHVVAVNGRQLRTAARAFALAAGGIENPRLLLCSTDPHPGGLGNGHDLVGRFFMEHAYLDVPLGPESPAGADLLFYRGSQRVGTALAWGQLSLTEGFMRGERVPGLTLWFTRGGSVPPSVVAAARLKNRLLGRTTLGTPMRDLRAALDGPGEILRQACRNIARRVAPGGRGDGSSLRVQLEQTPDPGNRVRLTTELDRFGQRRAELLFRLTEEDRRRHGRSLSVAAGTIGLDGPRVAGAMEAMLREGQAGFFSHHMGTTRMHEDPRQGVVDANCRVHGVSNLFVAGSSVFPTGGTTGPTLTIVALALRLAQHLRRSHL